MTSTPVPVFAALGDETRWSILTALAEGDASASALAGRLPVSRQAIVQVDREIFNTSKVEPADVAPVPDRSS